MSTTSYPWPAPTAEPWDGALYTSDGQPFTDGELAALLEAMAAEGPGATESRTYATYHREAQARGIVRTAPHLVCTDDSYPMNVLQLRGYLPIGGRMKARVVVELVDGTPEGALVDTADLQIMGAVLA